MNALSQFFTPEAGQARRNWLDTTIRDGVDYYLGPTGMAPRLNALATMNPVQDMGDSMGQFRDGDYTGALVSGATAVAPAVAGKFVGGSVDDAVKWIEESLLGTSLQAQGAADAGKAFALDEDGAIRAFHGSPHDFDKFSMDKIGTGEGAQAYGHGLYFAENEDVAQAYKGASASAGRAVAKLDGVPVSDIPNKSGALDWLDSYGSIQNTRTAIKGRYPEALAELEDLVSSGRLKEGSMYEVSIDADPADFLDWDAPFSSADDLERFAARFDATNPELRKRLEDFGYLRQQMGQPMPDGSDIIREIMGGIGNTDAARASSAMREAGIPGIRYLDQGSRPTSGGEFLGVQQVDGGYIAKVRVDGRGGCRCRGRWRWRRRGSARLGGTRAPRSGAWTRHEA